VCDVCHAIRDVPRRGVPRPVVADEDLAGYRVTDVDVVFRGVCPDCAARP